MAQKGKFLEIKDYLNNHVADGKGKAVPTGAVRSVWMTLPPEPKNKFDEVYPQVCLGN